jgi:hypothetical protein
MDNEIPLIGKVLHTPRELENQGSVNSYQGNHRATHEKRRPANGNAQDQKCFALKIFLKGRCVFAPMDWTSVTIALVSHLLTAF